MHTIGKSVTCTCIQTPYAVEFYVQFQKVDSCKLSTLLVVLFQ